MWLGWFSEKHEKHVSPHCHTLSVAHAGFDGIELLSDSRHVEYGIRLVTRHAVQLGGDGVDRLREVERLATRSAGPGPR